MNTPSPHRDHCNVCRRDVFICARCGKPSCMAGKTRCPGCEAARALDDAEDAKHVEPETAGSTS